VNKFAHLDTKKDAAKSTAEDAVATQTNLKAAATEEYNTANEEIISLNAQIADGGGSTIAAGTAAPTRIAAAAPTLKAAAAPTPIAGDDRPSYTAAAAPPAEHQPLR